MTVVESEHHGLNLLNEHAPHYMLETACLTVTKICLLIKVRTAFAQHPPGNRQLATLHNFRPATGSYNHAAQLPPGNRQLATPHNFHPATGSYSHAAQLPPGNRQLQRRCTTSTRQQTVTATLHNIHPATGS